MKTRFSVALCAVMVLMIQLTGGSADWGSGDARISEYSVAAGRIPTSPGVLDFNLTPLDTPGLLFHDIEAGKKYCIVDRNDTAIYISRLLVDNNSFFIDYYTDFAKKNYNYTIKENGILTLPEGFAISVEEGAPSDTYARFSITRYGKEIDNRVMRAGEVYEYRMDLDGDGQDDDTVMRFVLERASLTMAVDDQPILYSVQLNSFRLISPDVHKFDLTSEDGLDRLIFDAYKDSGDESLNFSVNDARKIPASSFIYETSMYRSDDGGLDIAWLGQPFHVIDHNASTIKMSRWLVDSYKRTLEDGETLMLPEGFSMTVTEIDTRNDPRSARFLLMRNGEQIDEMVLRAGDFYEYKMDMNGVMRFNLDAVFAGTTIDLVQLRTFQLISPEVLSINNGDTIHFRPEMVYLSGQPYYVIDQNDKSMYVSRLLVDEGTTHELMKGSSVDLPGGFGITLLDIVPAWDGQGGKIMDGGYGRFSITENGKEIDNRSVKAGEMYEYRDGHLILSFRVEAVSGKYDYRNDYRSVRIGSVRLISPEVLKIEKGGKTDFFLEGYSTNIVNRGETIRVSPTDDIDLVDGGTTFFMGNWFGVRIRSDAASVITDRSGLTGAFEYLVFDRTDFNLTSERNPAILFAGSAEKLNFSIEQVCQGCNSYRIPALIYTTGVYHAQSEPEIAWLGRPYSVIENTASRFVISRFLMDEDENDYHLLGAADSLALKDGFNLKLAGIDSGTAKFSLLQDGAEVDSSILKAGEVYQYKKDLKGNGKDDNWLIRFNVESIYAENNTVRINGIRMISPQVLEIDNGDIIENYRIYIGKDANTIEVRMDPVRDVLLKEDDVTGILDDAFHIRLYRNGNAAAVVLGEKQVDPKRSFREMGELKAAGIVNISAPDMPDTSETPIVTVTVKDVPSSGIFEIAAVLLSVLYVLRKRG